MIKKYDFEALRRREFIYRHYRSNVREPFLVAKIQQFEELEKTRSDRKRFKAQQYNQYLQFINKHVSLKSILLYSNRKFFKLNNLKIISE